MDATRQESTTETAHPAAVTRYALDPDQNGAFDSDIVVDVARILGACLDHPDLRSELDGSAWSHRATVADPRDGRLAPIRAAASMTQTATRTVLRVAHDAAAHVHFAFEHHEDDPERGIAINQNAATSLTSIRRHHEAIDELVRQIDASGEPRRPSDLETATARAFALVEALDPRHCGLPVWYSAPWRFGTSKLSQEISRLRLPAATRWWRHGNLTLVSDRRMSGATRIFGFRPFSQISPLGADALDLMRLINIAEDNR